MRTYLEQQECDDRWRTRGNASREIKGTKELWRVEEGREKRKDGEDVDLGDAQELGGVHVVPVSEFVG